KMNEGYADGEAMLILMEAYQKTEAQDKAMALYNRILELYPDKDIATEAKEMMGVQEAPAPTE
ncbi:MAG: hypothetical protein UHS49_05335, partial [Faecalimonas sp.]|nr:hypothetical protein [Faecalimonas sp.]